MFSHHNGINLELFDETRTFLKAKKLMTGIRKDAELNEAIQNKTCWIQLIHDYIREKKTRKVKDFGFVVH
jgi:hypothetical protein